MRSNIWAIAANGAIYGTVMLHPGDTLDDMWGEEPTGSVYKWQPGADGFLPVTGTEMTWSILGPRGCHCSMLVKPGVRLV